MSQNDNTIPKGQWNVVSDKWNLLGPPLRPVQEDISLITSGINKWLDTSDHSYETLILGVTPEYYFHSWPGCSGIKATDNSKKMIADVWPGAFEDAQCSSWLEMDWPENKFSLALCDGGLQLLDYPLEQHFLVKKLSAIIKDDGLVILRLFARPSVTETLDSVFEKLDKGGVSNLNQLKIVLGMALQKDCKTGVVLNDIWASLTSRYSNWNKLAEDLGVPVDYVNIIDAYKDNATIYNFMSVEEVVEIFEEASDGRFQCVDVFTPTYACGELCPTLVFKKSRAQTSDYCSD
ncbi:MAG: hypothetical protein ACI9W6_000894 [Motiliproteus sp.]|jgi:hypothetical protein